MLIRLEHNGRIVHEIDARDISGEWVIGRSHGCSWPVPKEDTVASSRHAALFLKGRAVWLKDLGSTNGTFHKGKRIEKLKLAVGDRISIGNCLLCVEKDRGEGGRAPSEIQVLTGKSRGQRKPLLPPVFTIGSDPTSSLVFLDMLVSRRHADISVKEDGSCWIRDLGSKNGTSVNGLPLRDDKERLLKDGDRIAVSHLEMEFHDGAVKRSNKQAWLRLGILGGTLVVALALYWTYQHLRSPAESFILKARRLAAVEAFPAAREELEKAVNARHAGSNQVAVEELRRLLGLWETTVSLWQGAQEALAQGKWVQASRDLGMLQASKKEAWEWNDKAVAEKDAVFRTKTMLDALLQSEATIAREDIGYAELASNHEAVRRALDGFAGESPSFIARLKSELETMRRRQETLLEEGRGLEQALDRLKEDYPPYGEIVEVIAQARKSSEGVLKRRAAALDEPVRGLAASFARLNDAAQAARNMDFPAAITSDLALPPVDACSRDPRASQARQRMDKVHANLKVKAGQMAFLFGEIEKRVPRGETAPVIVQALQKAEVVDKVMACDSLSLPLPKRSRTEPSGEFDRVLGVEEFYTHLSALPGPVDPAMLTDLPFASCLTQVRETVVKIEALNEFLGQPDNQWLAGGKVAEQLTRLATILEARDAIVKAMADKAKTTAGREALVAGGIAARLSTGTPLDIKGQRAEDWLAAELKKQRSALFKLNEEYSMAEPARQIEIRNDILKAGLPGDPIVRRMWAVRDAASSARP